MIPIAKNMFFSFRLEQVMIFPLPFPGDKVATGPELSDNFLNWIGDLEASPLELWTP